MADVWMERFATRPPKCTLLLSALLYSLLGPVPGAASAATLSARQLADMSIEELSDVEVTSVSRRPESLSAAAASVYVITAEDIRRTGATTLPDALRLAPNLQVARTNNLLYAISARGFNSNIANKLLVLVDGRTIYSPLFSGVFWDAQDLLLEDVERIEIIDGPGGATWGVNAVNGIINVITRSAAQSQGMLVSARGGTREQGASLRYGGEVGQGHFRVYGKGGRIDDSDLEAGGSALDGWERAQFGFRGDWGGMNNAWTVQGDAYDAASDDRLGIGPIDLNGANLLARWRHISEGGSNLQVQTYYDRTERKDLRLLQETGEIFDLDIKHATALGAHRIVWGGGYRQARDRAAPGTLFAFFPASRDLTWYNLFGQDQIAIGEEVRVTLGLRLEHNEYTGWETLPTVRVAWRPEPDQLVWGAVSRAVRAPARLDREIFAPPVEPFFIQGGPEFESEVADVIELGYRAQPLSTLSFSVTALHHRFDRLRSGQLVPGVGLLIENRIEGDVSGLEAWGKLQLTPAWRLAWGGMILDKDLHLKAGSNDPVGPSNLGNDPDYQLQLRSSFDLSDRIQLDVDVRHTASLPQPRVASYTAVDARAAWRLASHWELSLVLQDILDSSHVEFGSPLERSEFERAAFVRVRWQN